MSVDGKVLATAVAGSDGKFFIKAGVGKNKVTVSKADPKAAPPPGSKQNADGTMPAGLEVAPPPPVAKKKVGVPEKYSNPDTSGLAFDIQKGMEPISISISSK